MECIKSCLSLLSMPNVNVVCACIPVCGIGAELTCSLKSIVGHTQKTSTPLLLFLSFSCYPPSLEKNQITWQQWNFLLLLQPHGPNCAYQESFRPAGLTPSLQAWPSVLLLCLGRICRTGPHWPWAGFTLIHNVSVPCLTLPSPLDHLALFCVFCESLTMGWKMTKKMTIQCLNILKGPKWSLKSTTKTTTCIWYKLITCKSFLDCFGHIGAQIDG